MSLDWCHQQLRSHVLPLILLTCKDARDRNLVFVYSSEHVVHNMDRTLFKQAVYHGFSSSVSALGSVRRCSQLPSSFSLFRTLVVRNTAAFSPSETQTCACHIPAHHLRYYTHCRLHHNDILISNLLNGMHDIRPPFELTHNTHNQPLVFRSKSGQWRKIQIYRVTGPDSETHPLPLLEECHYTFRLDQSPCSPFDMFILEVSLSSLSSVVFWSQGTWKEIDKDRVKRNCVIL